TDFGIAARLSGEGNVGGTLQYMAPEAFDGDISAALDVYGLAASLFWLMTGEPPFLASSLGDLLRQINQGLPRPAGRLRVVPEVLEEVLRAGLSASPARRPSLDDFLSALRGSLNLLLADTILLSPTTGQAPVQLRLMVSRQVRPGSFVPVATSQPQPG